MKEGKTLLEVTSQHINIRCAQTVCSVTRSSVSLFTDTVQISKYIYNSLFRVTVIYNKYEIIWKCLNQSIDRDEFAVI